MDEWAEGREKEEEERKRGECETYLTTRRLGPPALFVAQWR